jgi:hypothetical protein
MILILLFLIIIYFIIKLNKNEHSSENIENIKNIIEPIKNTKHVRFSDKLDYYEEKNELQHISNILPPLKVIEEDKSSKSPSFYSNTWYGNYYLENTNNTELKSIYDTNNEMNLNPRLEDEKNIDFKLMNSSNKIKDIYNSYANNYKDYEKKKIINNNQDKILDGASDLSYYVPDTWIYENENIINGGNIQDGLTGYDDMAVVNTSIY